MQRGNRWMVVVLILAGLQLSACTKISDTPTRIEPASVEPIEGTELSRLILTPRALERLDIKMAPVREAQVVRKRAGIAHASLGSPEGSGAPQKVVPYSAVLYDAHGKTWLYTSPEPLTFVRQQIEVDFIEGDLAVVSDGPPTGTEVVTVGAAELFGTEFKIGH